MLHNQPTDIAIEHAENGWVVYVRAYPGVGYGSKRYVCESTQSLAELVRAQAEELLRDEKKADKQEAGDGA